MALRRFVGKALRIKQFDTGSIDSLDATPANNTFRVTIGNQFIEVPGNIDSATTAANLVAALQDTNAHAYFKEVTWDNPSVSMITGEANTAGTPFEATLTAEGGGTGTATTFSTTTASAGPAHFDTPENYENGLAPGVGDDVLLENSAQDILFGLAGITAALNSFRKQKSFTGKIGLDRSVFQKNEAAVDSTAKEYRETYLSIDCGVVDIGEHTGPGTPAGSPRVKIRNIKAGASVNTVHSTAASASEKNLPAVRFLASDPLADFVILAAPGGVGIGSDFSGELATIGTILVRARNVSDKVFVGVGVTLTSFDQTGGTNILMAATDITDTVIAKSGILTVKGDFNIATLTNLGATIFDNHTKSGGSANGTVNNIAGILNGLGSNEPRTWDILNQSESATLTIDPTVITIATPNLPGVPFKLVTTPE